MKHKIRKIFNNFGIDIHRFNPEQDFIHQVILAMKNVKIDIVFDIGANLGQFSSEIRSKGYNGKIVSFEPLTIARQKLVKIASKDANWHVHDRSAVGNFDGSIDENGDISYNDYYQLGFQTGYKGQYFNLAYGADGFGSTDVLYLDYTGGFDLSDSFFVGINAAYSNSEEADSGYQGFALYLQNEFSDIFSLGFRPEFFTLTSGTGDQSVSAFTLSGNTSLSDSLKLITELRYDTSDDIILVGGKDNATGLTIAAVYSF